MSVSKGHRVSLAKSSDATLSRVRMGLGWDAVNRRGRFGSRQIPDRIMAKLSGDGAGWTMTALGIPASGRTFHDLLPALAGAL